jgi:uncharacterized protein YkwD/LysM repeat protein
MQQLSSRYNHHMWKFVARMFLLILAASVPLQPAKAKALPSTRFASQYDLVDAVNNTRSSHGLYSYSVNSILMQIAQLQAEYIAAIGVQTDISADGLRPFQRALAAGYPVAGDITNNVGYLSELLFEGSGASAQDAVYWWLNDPGHEPYLLSSLYLEIGAGVASVNGYYYYVIVVSLPSGGIPVPVDYPTYNPVVPSLIPNTPNADGSITYIVKLGDTLGIISQVYGIPVSSVRALNNLSGDTIYPDQVLIIQAFYTQTPTSPTKTSTQRPTITPWPTSTSTTLPLMTELPVLSTPIPSQGKPITNAGFSVILIIAGALLFAGILTILGKRPK